MNSRNNIRNGERDKSSSQSRSSSHPPQQRLLNFNSARTARILALLLLLTLITQAILIAYHDDFVLELNSLEGDLLEDMSAVNSAATDAINAAYEYNDGGSVGGTAAVVHQHHQKEIITNISSSIFSMEPIDILKRAGVDHTAGFVPSITGREAREAKKSSQKQSDLRQHAELPALEDIQSMYGNHSYVLGLDRCQEYRATVHPEHRLMGPAGIFNSATNLLNRLLKLNCVNQARVNHPPQNQKEKTGMLLQAPWGKHNPVSWRLHHEAAVGGKGIQQADFLPVVMIKDPITWMASMCRHPYEARWRHATDHCPNLVPNKFDKGRKPGEGTMEVKVKFATQHIGLEPIPDPHNRTFVPYTSLVELWNIWYNDWHDASFPRLMVRFEDLLFHAEDTISQVCACGGGTMKPKFRYVEASAKGEGGPHAGSAGFLASLVNYGNKTLRMEGILKDSVDAEYARDHLDKDLMELFGYAPI